jgi:hypothetical protein
LASNDWARLNFALYRDPLNSSDGVHLMGLPDLPNGEVAEITDAAGTASGQTADPDLDGIVSALDNCPAVANPTQIDTDGDGYGDACDPGTTIPPTVSITAPAGGSQFSAGADIAIAASAADSDGAVVSVSFFAGATHIGADSTSPYTLTWPRVLPGQYSLTARATDDDGAVTMSAPVAITVHGADLGISQSVSGVRRWGLPLVHTVTAANAGPDAVTSGTVTATFSPGLAGVTWSCTASPGSSCPPAGSGNINATVNLLAGGQATFVATGTFAVGASTVTASGSIVHPMPGQDLATWNNSAATTTSVADVVELAQGSRRLDDLGALAGSFAQTDWYRLQQTPRSSYEVVVDETSGDIGLTSGPAVDRMASDGASVLQSAGAVGVGPSRTLRWQSTTTTAVTNEYIRVRSNSCTTNCGPDDVYRLRFYDTSYTIPRFSNAGGQFTALIIFNPGTTAVSGQVYFWSGTGSLLHADPLSLPAKQSYVLLTANVPALQNMSGSITVTSNGAYGQLIGKATSSDPASGMAFDSLMEARPR